MENGLLAAGSGSGSAWQRKRGRCQALAVVTTLLLGSAAHAQSTYTTRYTYDADGNRTSVTYPSGNVVTYTFDYADRPYSAASGASTLVGSAAYLPFGPETQIAYGNGTTKTMLYDSRYRVLAEQADRPVRRDRAVRLPARCGGQHHTDP
jgi:YD repeat-containing protein